MTSPTFSASLSLGRQHFEEGQFHAAHEAWESGWRQTQGRDRRVLQVLVLWAAALHQHQHGQGTGASRLILRALERLGQLDDDVDGLDLEGLREGLVTSLELARGVWTDDARPEWPPELVASLDAQLDHRAQCPYCGEAVMVSVALEEGETASYTEDCPSCCRPWEVNLSMDGEGSRLTLGRDDG